jgi:large subunit ribosomal protein LP2
LAAYLLLVAGGNESPSAADVSELLSTVGIEVSKERLDTLIADLEGKDVNQLIALGREKLNIGGGGGGAVVASSNGSAAAVTAPSASGAPAGKIYFRLNLIIKILNVIYSAAAAAPEEKAKPKEEEVDALDGGMDMFGGGGGGGDY